MSHLSILPTVLRNADRLAASLESLGLQPLRGGELSGFQETLPVEVRVASFPFTEYGALKGKLLRISADNQPADASHPQDYFEANVRLSSNRLERSGSLYALRPGMAITALLQLGPRPVLSLLGDRFTAFFDSTRSIR